MSGGAAMRAVSKIAGFDGAVVHGGLRKAAAMAAPPAEKAVQKSSIPVSAMLSSSSSTRVVSDVDAIQMPRVVEEDLVMAAGEPMPRVVFAGVTNIDGSKEATAELKDALDKVHLSLPKSSASMELAASNQLCGLSDSVEANGTLSAPNHAVMAFQLLSTSTEIQNVFASIGSDPNVFEAVMHNTAFQEHVRSNQTRFKFQEPVFRDVFEEDLSAKPESRDSENWWSKLKNIGLTTVDMVTRLSSKFHDTFGYPSVVKEDETGAYTDRTIGLGTSLMGLVTLVVMVVLLKRV